MVMVMGLHQDVVGGAEVDGLLVEEERVRLHL